MRQNAFALALILLAAAALEPASAQSVKAAGIDFSWSSCEADTITQKGGQVVGVDSAISIRAVTAKEIRYGLDTGDKVVEVPLALEKVASVCFADKPRALDDAFAAYWSGNFSGAAQGFAQVAADKDHAWAKQFGLYFGGSAHQAAGEFDKAEALFAQLLKEQPDTIFASEVQLGQIRVLADRGKVPDALALIASTLGGRNLGEQQRFDLQMLQGDLNLRAGKVTEATSSYRDAVSTAGRLDPPMNKKARTRAELAGARVMISAGDLAGARSMTSKALSSTSFENVDDHEARAFAYILEGDACTSDADKAAGQPAQVRSLLEKALERYLRVVATYGDDEHVDAGLRKYAFDRVSELASTNRLNLRDVHFLVRSRAASLGF